MGCCTSQENSEEAQRKIAVVGDSGVGKTSLIQRLMTDDFDENTPQEYIASALKVDEKLIELKKGKKVLLFIYDTGGQETFKHLRKLNYPKSDAVIICFSVDNIESLQNVKKNWVPEMQRLCPGIPMLLVGNKVDIRHESESIKHFVPRGKGENTAKKNKMVGYIECSAKTDEKVKDVFEKIAQVALQRKVIRKEETA
ncbi:ras-like GTP-binding protein rhoA [Biomphalaria pfeifferi]|uniref:Ras-like GTP-binding protein rhoA n=1 Tax=Biomphalaria pfeifferi TaxID=112525 RepID=A0AAD8C214_BIOPF|nr:ras-like GTP-binding protein rhoA [Biomphalaria pfeifferi]